VENATHIAKAARLTSSVEEPHACVPWLELPATDDIMVAHLLLTSTLPSTTTMWCPHRFSRKASADPKPLPEGDGPCGITVSADTYAGEQFDNIAVRQTRWLAFRQTATRSCGPTWPHSA
jgi:hypothetical protein